MKSWGEGIGGNGRTELMAGRAAAAETPAERVKRVLVEATQRSDLVLGVKYIPAAAEGAYEMHTTRKHHTIPEEQLLLVRVLNSAGLEKGRDFDVAQSSDPLSGGNGFAVSVKQRALESALRHSGDGPLAKETVITRLGMGKDSLLGLKRVPPRMEGAYEISTAKSHPGFAADEVTLVHKLRELGLRKGEDFSVQDRGEKGVAITVKQSVLEQKLPQARMPARGHD